MTHGFDGNIRKEHFKQRFFRVAPCFPRFPCTENAHHGDSQKTKWGKRTQSVAEWYGGRRGPIWQVIKPMLRIAVCEVRAFSLIKFGTDGWRGVIAEDYTFDNVRRAAQGKAGQWIVISHDKRFGSEHFTAAEVLAATA